MRRREQSIQDFQQILNQGYTFNLIIAIIQGLIAPFIFGYSISCINLPQETIKQAMGLDNKDGNNQFRLLTSLLFIGGFVGSMLGSKLGDWIGRKKAFIVNDFIYMISSAIGFVSGLSYVSHPGINDKMFALFCVSRFLLGVAACLGGTITPMYVCIILYIYTYMFLYTNILYLRFYSLYIYSIYFIYIYYISAYMNVGI